MKALPQFSTRHLLGLMFVAAIAFAIIGLAVQGQGWAIGVTSAMAAAGVMLLVFAVLFGLLWVVSAVAVSSVPPAESSDLPGSVAEDASVEAEVLSGASSESDDGKDSVAP